MNRFLMAAVATTASLSFAAPVFAAEQKSREEIHAALQAIASTAMHGPATIRLLDQGTLELPKGMIFADKAHGKRLMEAAGNEVDDGGFVGLVMPEGETSWLVTVDYAAEGHVSDSDAGDIKPDKMLKVLQDGTEEGNKFRAQKGIAPIEVSGWAEPPAYNALNHTLLWSALLREKGAPANASQTVNYNTRVLGRQGYFLFDMIDDEASIAGDKVYAKQILDAAHFDDGKRYTDFNASTDHVAAYGLAALIGGVAAKKIGLLAMAGVFLAKVWKLAAVGIAIVTSSIRKMFGRSQAR
jgi:uncharacterized membrane-anchored protein